jgi:hypothetical protein
MKNSDIFLPTFGYDMVVSITQDTINKQLAHLASKDIGVIKTRYLNSYHHRTSTELANNSL